MWKEDEQVLRKMDSIGNEIYSVKGSLKIALAELDIAWEDKETNKKKCEYLTKAAAEYAELLIFPEMTLTGFSMNTGKIAEERENSPTLEFFMELSEKYQIAIAFGMAEYENTECMKSDQRKAKNKCYLVSGQNILLEYAKLHPFSFGEESKYYQGGNELAITEINTVKLSSFICYDLRFPEPFQIASREADVIFVIANWPAVRQEHWNTLLKARAIENQCYVAGINRCGSDPALLYPEASAVYDPYGNRVEIHKEVLPDTDENNGEGRQEGKAGFAGNLYFAEIDKGLVEKYRKEFQLKKDRRETLYKKMLSLGRIL